MAWKAQPIKAKVKAFPCKVPFLCVAVLQVLKWKARRHIKRGGLESVGSGPSCHPADPGAPVPGPGGGGTGGGAGDASAVREAQSRNRAAATANASEKTPLLG